MGGALSSSQVVLAFDSGPGVGLGHRRRAEALATALAAVGFEPVLHALVDESPLPDSGIVVVDSYRWRADDPARFSAPTMAAVDDLLRDLAVALVIDPAPGAEAADHPAAGRALAGSRFAIVDPRLATLRRHPVTDRVSTVLVATGGGGLGGVGRAIAAGIVAAVPALAVRLATPPGGAPDPEGVEAVCRVDGLAPELARADIVVTAGGVTLLESLCLGRPTITYVLADNQRRQAGGAAAAGAVELVEMSEIPLAVLELVASAERRGALARRARQVIDGLGASRVAEAIRDL